MEIEEILKQCTIDDKVVRLPDIQLDRKTYCDVAKRLELIGGKWNRKFKGFLFENDPTELLADVQNGEKRNLKKEFQFFETPAELAEKLVSYIIISKLEQNNSFTFKITLFIFNVSLSSIDAFQEYSVLLSF